MEETKLFRIGDVAKMYHISVGSLRHYEKAGLLTPEYVDESSGYRYYSARQLEVLNTIRYLRALDLPLEQIAEFLQNREIDVIEEKLRQQKETVIQKQKELAIIERKIENRLRQIQDARTSELNVIRLVQSPSCRIVWMQDSLKLKTYLDLEGAIRKLEGQQKESLVFLGKVGVGISRENLEARQFGRYDLVFLVLDDEDVYEGNVEEVPQENCVSIRFRGSHNEAAEQYQKLTKFIREQGMEITGFSREITMIDNGITSDPEKFVTEIRIPVQKMSK